MHELTLVRNLVAKAIGIAEKQGITDIGFIEVEVGEVSGSDIEEIYECFDFLKGEILKISHTKMSVQSKKARARCKRCGAEFGTEAGGQCPRCGSTDIELTSGEEARVVRVGRRVG